RAESRAGAAAEADSRSVVRRSDILDHAEDRAAFVPHVSTERDRAATDAAPVVHDDVAQHCGRGPIDIAVDVEVAANCHHRARRAGPGRYGEVSGLNPRVIL